MKQSLLLYLFILALVFNVFTYSYYSKEVAFQKEQLDKLTKKNKVNEVKLNDNLIDANYFSIENNEKAQNYFYSDVPELNIDFATLIPLLKDKLMDFNDIPNGNPYTGQEKLGANKFIINKIKVLNHRWIIADYCDGEYWGEVLLKYFLNDDKSISFEVNQSLLYQKQ
ncbi:MAG: hypothetical protein EXR18_00425 [Flavobacteriaceae bacterium]|nr:hypothetical protein [Flavobacteriaceae bacterium]